MVGGFLFLEVIMLSHLDKLLIQQYFPVYESLHKKLYGSNPLYTVVSLNYNSMLSSDSIAKFKQGINYTGSLYAILYKEQPILYFTLYIRRTSLIAAELIVENITSAGYDDKCAIQSIVTYCLLKLHQRKVYAVNRIRFHNTLVLLDAAAYKKLGDAICIV